MAPRSPPSGSSCQGAGCEVTSGFGRNAGGLPAGGVRGGGAPAQRGHLGDHRRRLAGRSSRCAPGVKGSSTAGSLKRSASTATRWRSISFSSPRSSAMSGETMTCLLGLLGLDERRGPLYLDGDAWESLFDTLYVPTRSWSRWRPHRRQRTTTWSGPPWCQVPATAAAATSPPGTSGPSTRSSPRLRGHGRHGARRMRLINRRADSPCQVSAAVDVHPELGIPIASRDDSAGSCRCRRAVPGYAA